MRDDLGLDPAQVSDEDKRRILGGLASIVAVSVPCERTQVQHMRLKLRRAPTVLSARDARLSVHAAYAVVAFIIDAWVAPARNHSLAATQGHRRVAR